MSLVTCHMTISLDGFVAGPRQSREDPIGVGGGRLHQWIFQAGEPGHEADARLRDEMVEGRRAYIMGRNMFGPVRGDWDEDWRGWWGEEPPYHAPVFVLTHYPHAPIEMKGGTTFHFVTEGFDAALAQAQAVAGGAPVDIAGGASAVRQALAAGAITELVLDVAPVLLGSGERLFDGVTDPGLTPVEVIASPLATHVRYRIGH
jgi:dihydrofolate reductase